MDRRWERIGGWCALGVGLCGIAKLAVAAALYAAVETSHVGHTPFPQNIHPTMWLFSLVSLAAGMAQLGVTHGVARMFRPPTRLVATVSILGYVAAGFTLLSALHTRIGVAAPTNTGLWLGLLTGFTLALWMIGVCAIDWRLRRLPTWLRVTGTATALLSFVAPILPPVAVLAIPPALVWWFGLGVVLIRVERLDPSPLAGGGGARGEAVGG